MLPASSPVQEIAIGGTLGAVAEAARWVESLARAGLLPAERLYDAQLCLEEALANIVRHGFAATAEPHIRLRFCRQPDAVLIEIEDNGAPFDPTRFVVPARPASLAQAQPGGKGIGLLRQFSDAQSYERAGGLNRLSLRFDGAAPIRPGDSSAPGR